jgi:hypothetical protein
MGTHLHLGKATPPRQRGAFLGLTSDTSKGIVNPMKIRFLKTVAVDVETRNGEMYDKSFARWQEVKIQSVYSAGQFSTVILEDGMILHGVLTESFEQIAEEKKEVSL